MNSIGSLDHIIESLYNSNFALWIGDNVIKPIVRRNEWHLKTQDQNIQLTYNKEHNFIKAKFHVGLIYVKGVHEAQAYSLDLEEYSGKPSLIGFINIRPFKEDEDVYFHITYHFNLFADMDVQTYFNSLYDQINMIKEDLTFRLGIDLLDDIETDYDNRDDDSSSEEEEEDEADNFVSPYDIGGN